MHNQVFNYKIIYISYSSPKKSGMTNQNIFIIESEVIFTNTASFCACSMSGASGLCTSWIDLFSNSVHFYVSEFSDLCFTEQNMFVRVSWSTSLVQTFLAVLKTSWWPWAVYRSLVVLLSFWHIDFSYMLSEVLQ